jgi:hypothetical protein
MKKSLTNSELKKYLGQMDRKEIENLICQLYQSSEISQKILEMKVIPESVSQDLLEEYQGIIQKVFFPSHSSFKPETAKAKRIVNEFKKVCPDPRYQAYLMCTVLDCESEILNFGYSSPSFISSMVSMIDELKEAVQKIDAPDNKDVLNEKITSYEKEVMRQGWDFGESKVEYHKNSEYMHR